MSGVGPVGDVDEGGADGDEGGADGDEDRDERLGRIIGRLKRKRLPEESLDSLRETSTAALIP